MLSLSYRERAHSDMTSPVVFMVHGRAGNQDVMWTFARCFSDETTLVAPQAPLADPIGGYSWWLVDSEVSFDRIEAGASALQRFITEYLETSGRKPRRVVAIGFSQGAACLSLLAQRAPEQFSAVGLLAGFVVKDKNFHRSGHLPDVFIAHGTEDQVVTVERAVEGKDYLDRHGFQTVLIEDKVGHKVGTAGMRALKEFMSSRV